VEKLKSVQKIQERILIASKTLLLLTTSFLVFCSLIKTFLLLGLVIGFSGIVIYIIFFKLANSLGGYIKKYQEIMVGEQLAQGKLNDLKKAQQMGNTELYHWFQDGLSHKHLSNCPKCSPAMDVVRHSIEQDIKEWERTLSLIIYPEESKVYGWFKPFFKDISV